MNKKTFLEKLNKHPLPVVVDLWAPWCGPCKMISPILEKLAREYSGRVDLWQVNADDNKELLSELGVYGIPTLIVYRNGQEVLRQVGAKPAKDLQNLFETLSTGGTPTPAGMTSTNRILRLGLGLAVAVLGLSNGVNWLILLLAALITFSAVYDRCPIWRALTRQIKKFTGVA